MEHIIITFHIQNHSGGEEGGLKHPPLVKKEAPSSYLYIQKTLKPKFTKNKFTFSSILHY